MWKSLALSVITLITVASCAWVSTTSQGENVRVVSVSDAQGCKNIGQTKVSLRDNVAGVKRDEFKVAKELRILGRNSAAEMGGDTISPATEVINGAQTFDVFKCMP